MRSAHLPYATYNTKMDRKNTLKMLFRQKNDLDIRLKRGFTRIRYHGKKIAI